MSRCRVGESMSEDYDNHALHCPECSSVESVWKERSALAVKILRQIVEDGSAWDEYMECRFCGNRYCDGHDKNCPWIAAHAVVDSELA